MNDSPHNLDDLVRATGFSKRQIRFYITKKLIPAAETRGPNATYAEEALRRLLLIAELKRRRVGPTRRKLTLEEIRHELDRPATVGAAQFQKPLESLETLESPEPTMIDRLAQPLARNSMPRGPGIEEPTDFVREDETYAMFGMSDHEPPRPPQSPLHQLVERLGDALLDISELPPAAIGSWLRVSHPTLESVLEIHVRLPENERENDALSALADEVAKVRRLLEATEDEQ